MKQKQIKVTKENLQEFVEQYKGKQVTIPEGSNIIAWHYINSSNSENERSQHISTRPHMGEIINVQVYNSI